MLHRDAARLVRGGSINSLKCLYGSGNMNKYQTIKQKSNECMKFKFNQAKIFKAKFALNFQYIYVV